jgi:uncharacterized damage-inducible protein DinB
MSTRTTLSLALSDVDSELASTRRMLERLPDEHLSWRPHAKSWTLGELAAHVANLPSWMLTILTTDELDLLETPPPLGEPSSSEEILRRFDANADQLLRQVESAGEKALLQDWTFRRGEHVLGRHPRVAMLRVMGISHLIHHRAQLGVYLRILDVPVPGMYGPSADDQR